MRVLVNGREVEVPTGSSVADLIAQLGLSGRPVAVERNRAVVPRAEHPTTVLAEGDRIELVALVGGG